MTAPTPQEMNAAIAVAIEWECPRCHGDWQHSWAVVPLLGISFPCGCLGEVPDFHGDSTESDRLVDAIRDGWVVVVFARESGYEAVSVRPDGSWVEGESSKAKTRPAAVAEAAYRALGLGE